MSSTDTSGLKILIVDDDLAFLKLAGTALSKRGFSVQTAEAGEEALAKIYIDAPQVVLLDVQMPRLTGDELVKMIKEWQPKIQVIMISSKLTPALEQDCLENGAYACLKKPVDFDPLAQKIRESLK